MSVRCKGCGRVLLKTQGDGLCTDAPARYDNKQKVVNAPHHGCAEKFLKWLPHDIAVQLNGTKLTDPIRAVAIDCWLEAR